MSRMIILSSVSFAHCLNFISKLKHKISRTINVFTDFHYFPNVFFQIVFYSIAKAIKVPAAAPAVASACVVVSPVELKVVDEMPSIEHILFNII